MRKISKRMSLLLAAGVVVDSSFALAGAFQSPTDLLVLSTNGMSGGTAIQADNVILNEYAPTAGSIGSPVNTINLPTNSLSYDGNTGLGLTLPDASDHDGELTVSQDGHQLVFATYLAAPGPVDYFGTDVAPNNVPGSVVPRVITVIHPDGTIDDSTQLTGADDYNSISIRQVNSLNGTQFWSTGNGDKPYGGAGVTDIGGLRYSTLGASSTTSLNYGNGIDLRTAAIFQGQLYGDGGSNNNPTGEHTLSQIGNGLTTSGAPAWTPLPSTVGAYSDNGILGNQSANFLTVNDGDEVLYQSDSTTGDLEKYTLDNGEWVLDGRLVFGKDNIENVAARVNGNSITVYISNDADLYQVTDTGGAGKMNLTGLVNSNPSGSYSLYPTLPLPVLQSANQDLRGISFAPSTSAAVGNQIWGNPTGGNWSSSTNWADGVPDAAGATAIFGPNSPGLASNGQVTLDASETVGHVVFSNTAAGYTIAANPGQTLTINNNDPNASGVPSIYDEGGTHTISAPISLAAGVTISSAYQSALTISGSISGAGGISTYGLGHPGAGVTQAMLGVVTLSGSNNYSGTTTVNSGTLTIAAAGALPSGGNVVDNGLFQVNANTTSGNISGTGTLSIGSISPATLRLAANSGGSSIGTLVINGTSKLDITNNHFTVADPGGVADDSTYTSILGWIKSGNITSSTGYTSPNYGVGLVDGNDGVHATLVSTNEIEVAYTLEGDANLDGKVDASDFSIFAPNFGLNTTLGWEAGDFNYDGKVDASDFSAFAPNFGLQDNGTDVSLPASDYAALDAFAAANGLTLTSVPEPSCLALIAIGSTAILSRRRTGT